MIAGIQTTPTDSGPQFMPRYFLLLTIVTVVAWVAPPAVLAICVAAAVYALRGSRQALEALILLAFLLLMSRGPLSMVRWLIVFAAFGRVIWDTAVGDARVPKILIPLAVFGAYVVIFSLFTSKYPDVSIFKLVSFSVGTFTLLILYHRTQHLTDYWLGYLFTLGAFILIASLPLYGLGAGFSKNGVGFQGILAHPQTYGPVLAPVAALVTGFMLFRGNRSWLLIVAALMAWYGMYASQARTSIFATVLAFGVTAMLVLPRSDGFRRLLVMRRLKFSSYLVAACMLFLVFWNWDVFYERTTNFIQKDDGLEEVDLGASFVESRGRLLEFSLYNFKRSPVVGIGFGVPSSTWDWEHGRLKRGFMGLPTSASVEKGFLPTAVLEEVGIVGAVLVLALLISLFWPMVKLGSPLLLWMSLSAFFTNLGEATFFSIGGIGFYFWLVLGFCYSSAEAKLAKRDQLPVPIASPYESAHQRRLGPHGRRRHIHSEHPSLAASRFARQ